jgi:transcriptional regulator with XRE-family HTH domain
MQFDPGGCVDSLREARRRKGWSQKDLAEKSGVGQDTISGIESGRHEPRPSTLRKLAEALGIEVAEFFREPSHPKVSAAPPSREWAVGAPEGEFNSWVETANLHDTLTLNRELSEVAESKPAGTDEHRRLLQRLGKVAEHFMTEFGPFGLVETSRSRPAAAHKNQEMQEGQETA